MDADSRTLHRKWGVYMQLMEHQVDVLQRTYGRHHVAYYLDMGLGKTFVGAEKMMQIRNNVNLVICQKSKVQDWVDHFRNVCSIPYVYNLTNRQELNVFMSGYREYVIGIINYDLIFRRPELKELKDFTLMLDESSLVCNENAKRSKTVLRMKPTAVILLSGTPTAGKYEKLWSQCRLLGWNISKTEFWNRYVVTTQVDFGMGYPVAVVTGYRNVGELKQQLRMHGAVFMKTEEVLTLPEQMENIITVKPSPEYKRFVRDAYIRLKDGSELVGDTALTKALYARQLCGQYSHEKLQSFRDLLDSTEDRLVVFYNFTREMELLTNICINMDRPYSLVNGKIKNLINYENEPNSVTFVQYQAGAMGLNLQKAHQIVYFTLPLGKGSCDLWEQSKKRIHRIGQHQTCFYHYLLVENSIEIKNLRSLRLGKDLTDDLFEETDS